MVVMRSYALSPQTPKKHLFLIFCSPKRNARKNTKCQQQINLMFTSPSLSQFAVSRYVRTCIVIVTKKSHIGQAYVIHNDVPTVLSRVDLLFVNICGTLECVDRGRQEYLDPENVQRKVERKHLAKHRHASSKIHPATHSGLDNTTGTHSKGEGNQVDMLESIRKGLDLG
jgi:hypothetical protein